MPPHPETPGQAPEPPEAKKEQGMKLIPNAVPVFVLTAALMVAVVSGAYAYFTHTVPAPAPPRSGRASAVTLHATVTGSLLPGDRLAGLGSPSTTRPRGRSGSGTISLSSITVDVAHSRMQHL